jgi:AAA domain
LLGELVTRTTPMFLVGATGAGKTNLGVAMAGGMAAGQGFCRWRSDRPARVLYIDGEMPLPLLQERQRDMVRRLGGEDMLGDLLHFISWQRPPDLPGTPADARWGPLNTIEGQAYILGVCDLVKPDVVMFDNVQSLIAGDMKDEVPWSETRPLVNALTEHRWFKKQRNKSRYEPPR